VGLLVLVWVVAVPTASVLGVLALRAAEGGSSAAVLSAGEAAALATASPTVSVSPSPTPTPSGGAVTERRVPGGVLGLQCAQSTPVLVWSVPDPGWQVDRAEVEDGGLRLRLEADDEEVRVIVVCRDGAPEVVEAVRDED
jgi:hypothetical protein